MPSKESTLSQLQAFLARFTDFCTTNSIDLTGISIDHICYKSSSKEEYERMRSWFEFSDVFVYQSIISERRIAIIGFKEALKSVCGDVWYLELSDQKPDGSQVSGADHVELLPADISYEEMLERFSLPGLEVEENLKPHHSTHDIRLAKGGRIKLTRERVVEKIHRDEMRLFV